MEGLTGRLFRLADLLQGHKRLTTAQIAERLGVSERTVRRDVARLQDLGLTAEVTPGRGGGVALTSGSLLPALRFTDDEALALGFGLMLARRAQGVALAAATQSAFARLGNVLGERLEGRLAALGEVLSEPPLLGPSRTVIDSSLLLDIAEAASQGHLLELSYRASGSSDRAGSVTSDSATSGRITVRRVEPYGLVHLNGFWYLPGYCHLRQDVRVFRLDRVRRAELHEETFVQPPDFDALETVSRSLAGVTFPGAVSCVVYLACSIVEASRLIPAGAVLLEPEDAGVVMRVHVPPERLEQIALYLLGFPFEMRVIGPEALRQSLRDVSNRAMGLSEGS